MTNFTSMLPSGDRPQAAELVAVTGASPPAHNAGLGSNPDLIPLVVAMVVMIASLQMLGRALAPLREVLRAVAAAAFATLLITSALVLVIYVAVSGPH